MDIVQIMATIQHRYPFLLVDSILEMTPGEHVIGLKNFTANEWFVQGHTPTAPIFPGALLIEHCAQVGCVLLLSTPGYDGKLALFAGIEDVKFRHTIIPGDQVVTDVTILKLTSRYGKAFVISRVNNKTVLQGTFTFIFITDPVQQAEA